LSNSGVSRDVVIAALKAAGVDVSVGPNGEVTLAKNGRLETLIFPEELEKQMLFRLKFHYGVPIHWFWNPQMIPGYKASIQ
jgi:hypothetical protein